MAEEHPGSRLDGRLALALLLVAGIAAIGIASVAGLAQGLFRFLATPPAIVRAAFAGLAIVLGDSWAS